MIYIGIDPGANGGIAFLNDTNGVNTVSMPETEKEILDNISYSIRGLDSFALIEKLHAMPIRGSIAAWKLGHNVGELKMALTSLHIPWEEVLPTIWQPEIGCPIRRGRKLTYQERKKILRARAQALFPLTEVTNENADALLIAMVCKRRIMGINQSPGEHSGCDCPADAGTPGV